jgi:CBS-domain-containing membrane protein
MLRVRDIMSRRVVTLRGEATASSAAWSLHTANVSGAPVRDRVGNLVGVLSKTDLAELTRVGGSPESTRVDDMMTPVVWSVGPDDPALAAVEVMVKRGIHRVVVVSGLGKVEGIVSPMDVMRALANGADFSGPGESAGQPVEALER